MALLSSQYFRQLVLLKVYAGIRNGCCPVFTGRILREYLHVSLWALPLTVGEKVPRTLQNIYH